MFKKRNTEIWPVYLEVGQLTRREATYNAEAVETGSVSYTVFVLSCNLCGALVHKADAHNKWHQELGV